ncbi:GNAT family N-acetyltransferase [Streptomyces alkaliphilus]|uniref:GNAT family N-acetyltransferase n=1 Tax=Streptomyces alkaliphilus TaxID=1472722 RepID=UPI0011817131|nr:GNAT family N-acetyltransferase [Streptomyces alkaliphilus]MQS05657.1 GNAT family N-acetyltransferase [Streptomyces alkaliphilus]
MVIPDDVVIKVFDPIRDSGPLEELSRARLPHEPVVSRDETGRFVMRRLVARVGDRLVAYADAGDVAAVDDLGTMHLWIVVHPEWARRGLATHLLDEARAFAAEHSRTSLVTAVDRHDPAARAWLSARGFREVGDLDVRRRRPRAGGDAPGRPDTGTDVEVVPTAVAGSDPDFLAVAAAAMSSRPLPDGTRMVVGSQEVRDWYFGPASEGQVYRSGATGRWPVLASVQKARSSGYSVEPVWAEPDDAEAHLTGVLTRVVTDADASERELVLALSPLTEEALDRVTTKLGFESAGGRTTWRLSW